MILASIPLGGGGYHGGINLPTERVSLIVPGVPRIFKRDGEGKRQNPTAGRIPAREEEETQAAWRRRVEALERFQDKGWQAAKVL